MWKRWKSTSAYCGTPQRIGHDRTAIESRYLHNLAASNSWTVSVAEERKFRREECMAKCSLSCVIYCTRMRQAARLKLCIAWIASLIIHQHFATLIHVLQICKLSTKNADLWNDSTPLLKVDLPRLLFLRRGVPLERCPDNDGQLLIKKSPKDVQRHWCFQCHVFTPNEQIVIHDDEKTILARTVAKCPNSMHLGPKTARTMLSVEGIVDEFASRSQCGHHLWPSHDSPLASRGPHKLLVDSWICCRFQWHWQRRILVQRKHASKYRPQPEQQAAFGATRMCHKSWTIYHGKLNVYLFF